MTIPQALVKLSYSKFRGRFKLDDQDRAMVNEVGMGNLRIQAKEMLSPRIFPAAPERDGHQTPLRGHPVFKAMHGTATCCRTCLNHWWRVPKGIALSQVQQEKILNLVMAWIEMQMSGGVETLKKTMTEAELNSIPYWHTDERYECPYRRKPKSDVDT